MLPLQSLKKSIWSLQVFFLAVGNTFDKLYLIVNLIKMFLIAPIGADKVRYVKHILSFALPFINIVFSR